MYRSPRRDKLVLEHLELVRKIAEKMARTYNGDADEFEGNGTIGLLEAAKRYDPRRNNNFAIYATRRIKGAILDSFRREDRLGRHERLMRKKDPARAERNTHHHIRVFIDDPAAWANIAAYQSQDAAIIASVSARKLIALLPRRLRHVMVMYHFEGKTDVQIADILEVTGSRVCQMRSQAVGLIRAHLEKKGQLA